MTPELEDKLYADFPQLYHNKLNWGFECPDTWEPILRKLSAKLELLTTGWKEANPNAKLDGMDYEPPYAVQVKEKFGGLRFYMAWETDDMYAAIKQAEGEIDVLERQRL
jgi:hypothetical protein